MVTIPGGPFLLGTPQEQRAELLRLYKPENDKFDAQWLDNELGQQGNDPASLRHRPLPR